LDDVAVLHTFSSRSDELNPFLFVLEWKMWRPRLVRAIVELQKADTTLCWYPDRFSSNTCSFQTTAMSHVIIRAIRSCTNPNVWGCVVHYGWSWVYWWSVRLVEDD
jgi:hypothetical protein